MLSGESKKKGRMMLAIEVALYLLTALFVTALIVFSLSL